MLNLLMGNLLNEKENYDEAETLIKKALEKDPENPAFIDSMAWVLYNLKD